MNIFRKLLADAIERNCGYHGRHTSYALEWNVAVDWGIPYFDTLYPKAMVSDYGPGSDADLDYAMVQELKAEWDDESHMNHMWQWVVKDMQRNLTDTDSYRSCRPEIFKRYGLPHMEVMPRRYKRRENEAAYFPAGKDGWILVDPWANLLYFDVDWEFEGRQGKHLVLTSFEGRALKTGSDDLAAAIREDIDGEYPNWWCQRLLAFIHECDLMFSREAVKSEFEYQVTFRLAQDLQEVADKTKELRKEQAEVLYWAERDTMTKETA